MLFGFYENRLSCNFCVYPRGFLVFGETPRITKLTGLHGWGVPGADPSYYEQKMGGMKFGYGWMRGSFRAWMDS